MLQLDGVSKKYRGGNYGVRDLSLSIGGGVLGLLGPNGAGKTTLMQMIATITRPTSGTIRFQDIDAILNRRSRRSAKRGAAQDGEGLKMRNLRCNRRGFGLSWEV